METLKAACNAMATRFEMVLHGENRVSLRAAAEEAIREIERLHQQLNLYSPSSEVSSINARADFEAVQVEPRLFQLLLTARRIHLETGGAFDVTIAPLVRCWGFMDGTGVYPDPEDFDNARSRVGMQHVLLDEKHFTIRFRQPRMMIDLGSIGKGYALDVAAESLLEAGIRSALIHGGTSTVCAIGVPPDSDAWKVAVDAPPAAGGSAPSPTGAQASKRPLAVFALRDESLSVSAVHGKSFRSEGKTYGHVIDPRTGVPAQGAALAAVALPLATESDALSTALLLGGLAGHDQIATLRPAMRTLVVEIEEGTGRVKAASRGIEINLSLSDRAGKP